MQNQPDAPVDSLAGKTLKLSSGTVLSKISGFAREVVFASYFGAGAMMDAFVAAYTVPALVRQVLGERALEAGFLPWFIRMRGSKDRGARLAREVAMWLAIVGLGVSAIIFLLTPALMRLIGLGFDQETLLTSTRLARVLVPFVFIVAFAAFFGTILQARGRFFLYGVAPAFFSLGAIAVVVGFSGQLGIFSLALGVLVGGMLFALVQIPSCLSSFSSRHSEPARLRNPSEEVRGVGRLIVPVIAGAGIDRLGTVADRVIASLLAPGSISSLYFAFRLIMLPYSVLALAVGRVVGPKLAGEADGHMESFSSTLTDGMRLASFLLLPVTAVSIAAAHQIVAIVYARGAFGPEQVEMTATALTFYSVGLAGMGFVGILSRAFASLLDTKTPVKIGAVALLLNIALSIVLSRTFLAHGGVALATSVSFWFQAIVLWSIMKSRIGITGEAGQSFSVAVMKIVSAAGIAGVLLRYLAYTLHPRTAGSTLELLWVFAVMVLAYVLAYLMLSSALGVAESRRVIGLALRRRR